MMSTFDARGEAAMTTTTQFEWADRLAWPAVVLAALASGAGLFVGDLYRDNQAMVAQARGTDLATMFAAVPILAIGLWFARAGSGRGRLFATGAVGYLVYTYAIYSFQVVISPVTPVHIAILGLSTWSLILTAVSLARTTFEAGGRLPRRTTTVVLTVIVVMFAGLWLSQIAGAITSGVLPGAVSDLDLPTSAVYALDLAFALPVLALAAFLLARRDVRGPGIAVAGLVFVVLMALSILGLFAIQATDGIDVDPAMTLVFAAIAVVAAVLASMGATAKASPPPPPGERASV
jgi:hypothetical protein